jgi:hypothetical protein
MTTMHLLFNHTLTDAQQQDARQTLGVAQFVPLPDGLQRLWSQVPPDAEHLDEHLSPVWAYLRTEVTAGSVVLVQGDFGATCLAVEIVQSLGAVAVYATTRRTAIEKTVDGKVVKTSVFEHVRFRRYAYHIQKRRKLT